MSYRSIARMLACSSLLALGLAGCSEKKSAMDIPTYPGSAQISAVGNEESEAGILYRSRRVTPDSVRSVAAFYHEELVVKRGWVEKSGLGPSFGDGNLKVSWQGVGPGDTEVLDPAKSGGQVTVVEDGNQTLIAIWQHVPAQP